MELNKVFIFIEIDSVLLTISDLNYEIYNKAFLDLIANVNHVERKIILILKNPRNKKIIKKYFHDDFFTFFDVINFYNLNDIQNYILEKKIEITKVIAIASEIDTIKVLKKLGIFTAYMTIDCEFSSDEVLKMVDYKKTVFYNLFDINYENLIYECNKFNQEIEEEKNEDDI